MNLPNKLLSELEPRLLFPVWAAADGLGQVTLIVLPFMISALVTSFGFSLTEAGIVLSIEMGVLSVVGLAVAPLMGRISRNKVAIYGAVFAVIGNLASLVFADSVTQLAVYRAIAGLGYGLALAAGNAAASNSATPELLYEHKTVLSVATFMAGFLLVPSLVSHFGATGLFITLAAFSALLIPLLLMLPDYQEPDTVETDSSEQALLTTIKIPLMVTVIAVAALAAYSVRESLAWSAVDQIGINLGMSSEQVGAWFAIGTLIALAGPLIVARLRLWIGAAIPAIVGAALSGAYTYLVVVADSQSIFKAMLLVWPFIYFFTVAVMMGIASKIDPQGRLVAACGGGLLLAYAVGPAIAGYLQDAGGKVAMGYFAIIVSTVSVLLAAAMGQLGRMVSAANVEQV